MQPVRVAWGTATGPTELSSYDAALADAGVHNYNLVVVSSIVPEDAVVERVGTAPDLGPAGNRLTVVEARSTVAGPGRASACLGWVTRESEAGLFYEAGGEDPETVEERVVEGIDAGRALREWAFDADPELQTATVDAGDDTYATAVVVGVYGESRPIL